MVRGNGSSSWVQDGFLESLGPGIEFGRVGPAGGGDGLDQGEAKGLGHLGLWCI